MKFALSGFSSQSRRQEPEAAPRTTLDPCRSVQPLAFILIRLEPDGIDRRSDRQQIGDEAPTCADVRRHQRPLDKQTAERRRAENRRRLSHDRPTSAVNRSITRSRS